LINEQGVTASEVAVGVQPILDLGGSSRAAGVDAVAHHQPNEQSIFSAAKIPTS
jgi:hypothetical protein